jgi:ubiquinone/menaquinone biosynthesis C-methylase UbiE
MMGMAFINSYQDMKRAEAYAKLEYPGTYYLAYRDLPELIGEYAKQGRALDVGCGTGRSTRFLRDLGFPVIGVDIAESMLQKARQIDPVGDYRLTAEGDLGQFHDGMFELVSSIFTFDNIPTKEAMMRLSREMGRVLTSDGVILNLTSAPELYGRDWASFLTTPFPENRRPQSGDRVRVIVTDVDDSRPVEDVFWTREDYSEVFGEAGLEVVTVRSPLATGREPFEWTNEIKVAPWMIYVVRKPKVAPSSTEA